MLVRLDTVFPDPVACSARLMSRGSLVSTCWRCEMASKHQPLHSLVVRQHDHQILCHEMLLDELV
ncbi:hypothetical protein D4764_14G0006320 [Takifugu flavidus]|uniref:Uncharacterized protein n=1 Tax=Takifugu flavidus TaxID=433684 RepID=A0A5C6P6Q9_9TELE|nr:hypothetical protein D4764_14G0006320 [Takifugu flavidus]